MNIDCSIDCGAVVRGFTSTAQPDAAVLHNPRHHSPFTFALVDRDPE
jgi:hypothetical protein